jgi:hypothetical protein
VGDGTRLNAPADGRVAVKPHGHAVKPVTVPLHVSRVSFKVPTKVRAYGAGCAAANVVLTDSVRGLETLPVPDANPSDVSLMVAFTAVPSCTISMPNGFRAIPENVTVHLPVTVRTATGNVVCTDVALLSTTVAVAVKLPGAVYACATTVPAPAPPSPKFQETVYGGTPPDGGVANRNEYTVAEAIPAPAGDVPMTPGLN